MPAHASDGHRRREHEGRLAATATSLRTVSRPFEVWRDREALAAVLREVAAEAGAGGRRGDHDDRRAVRRVPDQARGRGVRARRGRGRARRPAAERADDGRRARVRGGGARAAVGRRRRQLGGDGARGGRRAPRRAADRRRQHDRRRHPDRRRARRGDRAQRPRAAAGRRARLHRRAAHQPRRDRAARAGPRRLVPGGVGVLRDQRRRPPRPRPSRAGGLRLPDARRPPGHGRVRARAHRPAGVLRRRPARRGRDRRDRRLPARRAGAPDRGRGAPGAASAAAAAPGRRGRLRRFLAREVAARLGRAVADAARAARWHPPRRSPRCWRRGCADRRQGRRRSRPRRRRAAGVVHDARRARRAPSAARRARRRGLRRRGARRRPPLRAERGDLAPHGDPRHGAVRLAAQRPDPGRRAVRRPRARAAGRTTVLLPAALAARRAARVVAGDLRLDRRMGRRSGRRRPPRAGQGGRRPVRGLAARAASRSRG